MGCARTRKNAMTFACSSNAQSKTFFVLRSLCHCCLFCKCYKRFSFFSAVRMQTFSQTNARHTHTKRMRSIVTMRISIQPKIFEFFLIHINRTAFLVCRRFFFNRFNVSAQFAFFYLKKQTYLKCVLYRVIYYFIHSMQNVCAFTLLSSLL